MTALREEASALELPIVGGVPPLAALAPDSPEECAAIVRQAIADGTSVVPYGGGTLLDTDAPITGRYILLSTSRLRGDLDVRAPDSLVTCSAGVVYQELAEALAAAGQRLPMDPPLIAKATVGGVTAANAYGLLRCSSGPVGDAVVAMRMVTGAGEIVSSGAKVVKNTAGYDLCRLMTGSRGVLGVITEVTFRSQPVPPAHAHVGFVARDLGDAVRMAWELHETVASLDYVALLHDSAQLSAARVLFGMSGTARHVQALRDTAMVVVRNHGGREMDDQTVVTAAEDARQVLHGCGAGAAFRISAPRSEAGALVLGAAGCAARCVWLVPCGIVAFSFRRTECERVAEVERLVKERLPASARFRWLRRPLSRRASAGLSPSPQGDLVRRIKAAFDPAGILWPDLLDL